MSEPNGAPEATRSKSSGRTWIVIGAVLVLGYLALGFFGEVTISNTTAWIVAIAPLGVAVFLFARRRPGFATTAALSTLLMVSGLNSGLFGGVLLLPGVVLGLVGMGALIDELTRKPGRPGSKDS